MIYYPRTSSKDTRVYDWYPLTPYATNVVLADKDSVIKYTTSNTGYYDYTGEATITQITVIPVTLTPYSWLYTINPTPSDATVVLTSPSFTQEGNTIRVYTNEQVTWTVSKDQYTTSTGSDIATSDKIINVTLSPVLYTYTIVPDPEEATVILSAAGYTQSGNSISVPYNTSVQWSVSATGYTSQSGTKTVTKTETEYITLEDENCTFTIAPIPSDATVTLTAEGYTQVDNSITVPYGTSVAWSVEKEGYTSQSGTETVESTFTKTVTLTSDTYTFTINPTPSDATVTLSAEGYTQINNSITVPYNTLVSWSVSKVGYTSKTGSYTVTEDYTLSVALDPEVPASEDWEYTVNTDDSATLTKYIGTEATVVGPDYVKGDL